jgi:hypothetical protein
MVRRTERPALRSNERIKVTQRTDTQRGFLTGRHRWVATVPARTEEAVG